jgi:ketosteroid isomerase-like protein
MKENQTTQDVSSLIAALEDERCAAMLSSDMVKLDRLLDDRLRYVHSNGRKDDRFSYMKGFGQLWEYQSIDREDQTIIPLGDTALVYSTLHIKALVGGALREVHSHALAVWHMSGGVWRVVSIFSVGIPTVKP